MGNIGSTILSTITNAKGTQFAINITSDNKIKCVYIDEEGTETQIKLNDNQTEEYLPLLISFNMNELIFHNQQSNSIDFMKEWIEHPDIFKEYSITYHNKEFSVVAEVLFALIINEYKKKIEKTTIIDQIKIEIQFETNSLFIDRMKVALESLGFKGLEFTIPHYDYTIQEEILHFIVSRYEKYQKYKFILQRAEALSSSEHQKQLLTFDNKEPMNEKTFESICRNIPLKERNDLKLFNLDNKCIFLSSHYLNSIDDHINLIQTCKRLNKNMEKFHFNPVSITSTTIEYFPFLQTLNLYERNDCLLETNDTITKREKIYFYNYLSSNEIKQLEEWTQLKCDEILFDTNEENWTAKQCIFNDKIIGKNHLIFLIQDEKGERFGYYFNNVMTERYFPSRIETDINSFHFNLQSNGRLSQPMKFEIKDIKEGGCVLFEKLDYRLFACGELLLMKKRMKHASHCLQCDETVEHHEIENALRGEVGFFVAKRITVIQMI